MKYAIPLSLLLLIGIVPCIQRVPSRPAMPERRGPMNREADMEPVRVEAGSVPDPELQVPRPGG